MLKKPYYNLLKQVKSMKFKLIVPATTANIGPGFDISGMALDLYNEFEFDFQKKTGIVFTDDVYTFDASLVLDTFFLILDKFKVDPPQNLHLHTTSNIPIARGLGSSSTCIVAGVLAANKFANLNLDTQTLIKLTTEIEGHPDNVVSCLLGGFNMSLYDESVHNIKVNLHQDLSLIALIPHYEVSTKDARQVMPKNYTIEDVVFNLKRMPFIKEAFETLNKDLLSKVLEDKLHEQYRQDLIQEYDLVQKTLKDLNHLGFFISGAGPTMMILVEEKEASNIYEHLSVNLQETLTIRHCQISLKGAMII